MTVVDLENCASVFHGEGRHWEPKNTVISQGLNRVRKMNVFSLGVPGRKLSPYRLFYTPAFRIKGEYIYIVLNQ